MKKNIKRFLTLMLIPSMFSTLVSCGESNNSGGGWEEDINSGSSTTTLKVIIRDAGFGIDWLQNIATAFEAKTGNKVKVTPSYVLGEIRSLAGSDQLYYDLAVDAGTWEADVEIQGHMIDVNEVYENIPEGFDKPLKELMNPFYEDIFKNDKGKYYQMPWTIGRCGLVYNLTTLNSIYPNGFEIPNTTNELQELVNDVKTKDVYPFSFSNSTDYIGYIGSVWKAQYAGYDAYQEAFSACYYDDEGKLQIDKDGSKTVGNISSLRAYEVACELFSKNNGNVHKYAGSMNFTEAQAAFLGHGYKGNDRKLCAFMCNGEWLENEMQAFLSVIPQEIKMMKTPVISSIVETLEDKGMTDETLSKLILAIDKGETSYEGVSENDFNRVKEARNIMGDTTPYQTMFIPKSGKKPALAREFMKFITSLDGQKIFSTTLNGATSPFGYKPEKISPFIESINLASGTKYHPVSSGNRFKFEGYANIVPKAGFPVPGIYDGKSPETIIKALKDEVIPQWDNVMKIAKDPSMRKGV